MMGSSIGPQTSISIESTDYKFVSGYDWNLGLQVSTAGDVDGDGLDDILFGSSASDITGQNTGSAYSMLGSTISILPPGLIWKQTPTIKCMVPFKTMLASQLLQQAILMATAWMTL